MIYAFALGVGLAAGGVLWLARWLGERDARRWQQQPHCENCGVGERRRKPLLRGVKLNAEQAEILGLSPDEDGGYTLCEPCAAKA